MNAPVGFVVTARFSSLTRPQDERRAGACDYAGLIDLSSELSCVTPQGMWETSVSPIRRKEAVQVPEAPTEAPTCSVKRKASM